MTVRLAPALVAAAGTGGLVALQSRINGELGVRLEDGFLAAFISFGSGFVILCLVVPWWRPGRQGIARVALALRERRIPWWLVFGGAGGAMFVLSQGLTIGLLGVSLFTIAIVCGQTLSSLLLDHRGLAGMSATPATARRIAGAALAVGGVGIAVVQQLKPDAPYLALIIPFLAGLTVGWQQVVNGQVRAEARSAFTATFGNFLVGTVVLGIALAVHVAVTGWHPVFPAEWWLYLGGAVSVLFIAAQALLVRTTGALLMGLALLAGQLAAAVVFDLVVPLPGTALTTATLVGAALVFVAVVVAAVPRRGRAG